MRRIDRAEIIAAGSELLTPHRLDTNSLYLTGRLNTLGVVLSGKCVVGDDREAMAQTVGHALARADLVIVTGGLGPTADDVTREAVADVLRRSLQEDADILAAIRQRFERRGLKMPEVNRRQAMVPSGATVLANAFGTAPGLLLETDERLVVLLPGPPRELKPMFETHVEPRIAERTGGRRVLRRVLKITGRSESQVEELAFPVYSTFGTLAPPVETTILAAPGQIELHVSAAGSDVAELTRTLDEAVARLERVVGSAVFSTDGRSLEAVVGAALKARGLRIAAAESCTGGGLLSRLTDVPGSSAWVLGGVIAYANDVKIDQLGVPVALIAAHGAVSEPVAHAMADGVRQRLHADVGVAITGIAGPDGGSAEKPVGTVVIAISGDNTAVRTFLFPGDREAVRRFATTAALEMVRQGLESTPPRVT
jgi:nicotinamide-nucleotide amidase